MLRRVDWGQEPDPDQLAKMEPMAQQRWQVHAAAPAASTGRLLHLPSSLALVQQATGAVAQRR